MADIRGARREARGDDTTIKSFVDLRVWQSAKDLAVTTYAATRSFPKDEQFGLTSQVRRASTSVAANIAEGFGRRTNKDKIHFYTIAYGSTLEVKNFLYLSSELGYIDRSRLDILLSESIVIQKQLNSLVRSLS